MPRVDLEATKSASAVEGTALVRIGSLPHSFPDGDPVLKQFYLIITAKDAQGQGAEGRDRSSLACPTTKFSGARFLIPSLKEAIRGKCPSPCDPGRIDCRVD